MKQIVLLIALLCAPLFTATAQKDGLNFDKKFYECENKWVALPQKEGQQEYMYGVVYLDEQAGYTFDYQGTFMVTNGKFVKDNKPREASMKYRIEKNWTLLALLPEQRIKEMGLPTEPEWLHIYREGEDTTARLVRKGFILNALEASPEAIPVLLKAYAKDPHHKGLEFELGYAYNATEQYSKAIEVLKKAIEHDPKNYMLYKEIGYAYLYSGNVSEAEKSYNKGISVSEDKSLSEEMAFNMAGHYYQTKDKANFAKWQAIVKKNAAKDSRFLNYLAQMETELKQ